MLQEVRLRPQCYIDALRVMQQQALPFLPKTCACQVAGSPHSTGVSRVPFAGRNSICSLGGPIMLLAVAQQEDEVPTVRREAIAALVAVLEDDKRKVEVRVPPHKTPAVL